MRAAITATIGVERALSRSEFGVDSLVDELVMDRTWNEIYAMTRQRSGAMLQTVVLILKRID